MISYMQAALEVVSRCHARAACSDEPAVITSQESTDFSGKNQVSLNWLSLLLIKFFMLWGVERVLSTFIWGLCTALVLIPQSKYFVVPNVGILLDYFFDEVRKLYVPETTAHVSCEILVDWLNGWYSMLRASWYVCCSVFSFFVAWAEFMTYRYI